MRDSAPASFSTRMERMCLMNPSAARSPPHPPRSLREIVVPARGEGWGDGHSQFLREDHLGQPLPARHHREHVFRLAGDEVEEHEKLLLLLHLALRAFD